MTRHLLLPIRPAQRTVLGVEALRRSVRVTIALGQPVGKVPILDDVVALRKANLKRWVAFIRQYGLPEYDRTHEERNRDPFASRTYRVTLEWLQEIARKAAFLQACEQAALGNPVALRAVRKEERANASDGEEGRNYIRIALTEALADHVRPDEYLGIDDEEKSPHRGIRDDFALYVWGWWPLAILDRWVHRGRWQAVRPCAAGGCTNTLPPTRRAYCSETCRQREKKRRQRLRRHAYREG
ncbi:MAG TPA: hypothetical protein VFL31_02750 [Nitrospiraceae bacterium]|nr:hypothetical protein [Nitrospiraceae bacterium]